MATISVPGVGESGLIDISKNYNRLPRRNFLEIAAIGLAGVVLAPLIVSIKKNPTDATDQVLSPKVGVVAKGSVPRDVENPSLDQLIQRYYPEMAGKIPVENNIIHTEANTFIANFDPEVHPSAAGIFSILDFLQRTIVGQLYQYIDIKGNKIDFTANDFTYGNQLLVVVPDTPDFPEPTRWGSPPTVKGKTAHFPDRQQSATYVRVPSGPDMVTANMAMNIELAQMSIMPSTAPGLALPYNLIEVVNNGIGGMIMHRQDGLPYENAVNLLRSNRVEGGQLPFIMPEDLYNRIPIQPVFQGGASYATLKSKPPGLKLG